MNKPSLWAGAGVMPEQVVPEHQLEGGIRAWLEVKEKEDTPRTSWGAEKVRFFFSHVAFGDNHFDKES